MEAPRLDVDGLGDTVKLTVELATLTETQPAELVAVQLHVDVTEKALVPPTAVKLADVDVSVYEQPCPAGW
jgi:hypothetical protein